MHAELTRTTAAQCVAPDHTAQLGTTGADLDVADGAPVNSAVAPRFGIAVISIPAITVRLRIGENAVAGANDQKYFGADTIHLPIHEGHRVSIRGDGGAGVATVSLAK